MSPVMIKLLKEQESIEQKIEKFQSRCKHKNKVSVNKSNSGNLDYNSYWVENTCPNCNKFWISDKISRLAY